MATFFGRLAQLGRLIVFDKCATGLSERPPLDAFPSIEDRMDDVRAVMDAAGSERATIFGISEGGPMAALFAATYPERVERLVIYGSYARAPFGERLDPLMSMVRRGWGSGRVFGRLAPSWWADDATMRFLARYEAHSATPAVAAGIVGLAEVIDVRPTLASVTAPALVLHRRDDEVVTLPSGEELAACIPGADFVELGGVDHLVYVDGDEVLDHVEAFIAGSAPARPTSRVLATILFVDVVDSTSRAQLLGDERWHQVLRAFVDRCHQAVVQHRGRVRVLAGDGFMAVFDGPARAVRCAELLHRLAVESGLEVRCGVHTAEVDVVGDDVAGIGVHIAARVSAAATPGATFVTRTVRDLVAGSGLALTERGTHVLRGIDEPWELYSAVT
jgi:class 3 adenylate cyclase